MLSHSHYDPYNPDHSYSTSVAIETRSIAQAWGHNPGQKVLGAPQLYLFEPHQTEQMGWKPDVFLDITEVWDGAEMTLVSTPRAGGAISTRGFILHRVHASVGVFAAVSVSTACLLPGSPAAALAALPQDGRLRIEHLPERSRCSSTSPRTVRSVGRARCAPPARSWTGSSSEGDGRRVSRLSGEARSCPAHPSRTGGVPRPDRRG